MNRLLPILLFAGLVFECSEAYAKRKPPKDVAPVTFAGIRYSAQPWEDRFGKGHVGDIQAA